ncbi:MAG: error-prone DNA polymerase, partial [Phycisphaerales bacterium]|nr:error-prone DNA polymerase [Phycisphaerales bacterium]
VLARLAAADALRSMGLDRRRAVWEVLAHVEDDLPLFAGWEVEEKPVDLPRMSLEEQVIEDYDMVGLSLKAHPMELLRAELDGMGAVRATRLKRMRHGEAVRVAGLVLVRQRPPTASGITFYTLEDETGVANLIVRPRVYERCRRLARGAAALIVDGRVERQGEVVHVQASDLRELGEALGRVRVRTREFR